MARLLNIMLAKGRGGLETMALTYHNALSNISDSVTSLGHKDGKLKDCAQFLPIKASSDFDLMAAWQIKNALSKADFAFTHGNRATGLSLMWAGKDRHKIIPVVHNFRHKRHLERAHQLIAVSKSVAKSISQKHQDLKVHLIENFLPLTAHDPKQNCQTPPHIGVLGRLHPNKGFDRLILALSALKASGHDFRLSIAGTGPEEAHLRSLIDTHGLKNQTQFCGWIDDPVPYLRSLDLFVLPSRTEPFGIVLLEAMAAGIAVMATNIEGPKDLLAQQNRGIVIQGDDDIGVVEALIIALKSYLSDPLATLSMIKTAQAYALQNHDMKAGSDSLPELIKSIKP